MHANPSFRARRRRTPPGSLVRRAGLFLPLLLAAWLAGCSRSLPPLDAASTVLDGEPHLAGDLLALSRSLEGDADLDRARLALVEGLEGEPRAFAGGWLLQLRRESGALLVWAGAGAQRGLALRLATGDSLRLLRWQEDDRPGPRGHHRLLWLERVPEPAGARLRLVQGGLRGQLRALAEGRAEDCRWQAGAEPGWIEAEGGPAKGFREGPGRWSLERRRPLREGSSGWKLGSAEDLDSPYRCLVEFVEAARRGRWKRAEARADLSRLLALPGGGYSRRLGASLKLDAPELLDAGVRLEAPPCGPLRRLEAAGGRPAWRVEAERLPAERGDGESWRLVRLERIVGAPGR